MLHVPTLKIQTNFQDLIKVCLFVENQADRAESKPQF